MARDIDLTHFLPSPAPRLIILFCIYHATLTGHEHNKDFPEGPKKQVQLSCGKVHDRVGHWIPVYMQHLYICIWCKKY